MPTTTATIEPRTKIVGTNHTDVQISANPWNQPRIVAGGSTGGVFVRDPTQSDGWGLVDAVAGVFTCSGAGALPTWSTTPIVTNLTTDSLALSAAGSISWASRTQVSAPTSGQLTLTNQTATDFSRINLGGTTSAFPAIKRNGNALEVRTADDSGYTTLTAQTLDVRGLLKWGGNSQIHGGSVDGNIVLWNSPQTSFGLLQFGGTSASFPAIKRNGAGIDLRLADDSGYAALTASTGTFGTSVNSPKVQVGAGGPILTLATAAIFKLVDSTQTVGACLNVGADGQIRFMTRDAAAYALTVQETAVINSTANIGVAAIIGTNPAAQGAIRLAPGLLMLCRNGANTADRVIASFGYVATDELAIGDINTTLRLVTSLSPPSSPGNNQWWVETTGTSPTRTTAIKLIDGGVTRTIASVTY